MVHANRFCPPKALDEEEEAFLAEKEVERKLGEQAQKQADKEAQIEYKMAVAQQSGKNDDRVDLAKLMGAVRVHLPSRLLHRKYFQVCLLFFHSRLLLRKLVANCSERQECNN